MDTAVIVALIGAAATIAASLIAAWARIRDNDPNPAPQDANRTVPNDVAPHAPATETIATQALTPQPSPVRQSSSNDLSLEEAISIFEAEGGSRKRSALPGQAYYETAAKLRFVRCQCSYADQTYGAHEYIARNSRGTCYYVSYYFKTGNITCGPKGFHYCRPNVRECI